jgi:hypothetical protein
MADRAMTMPPPEIANSLEAFVLYGVVPAWLCAGLADWAYHRASRIEATSGTKESILHIVQLGEVGLPLLAALFLEVNALILSAMIVGLVLHQLTAIWDVRWADAARTIAPVEQHIHGVLEMAPIMVFAGFSILNGPAFTDLLQGSGSFTLELKRDPLPTWYLIAVLAGVFVMGLLPYGEELLRCLRSTRARRG